MQIRCKAENYFPNIERLIRQLSDGKALGEDDDNMLRRLLREYWNAECPFECVPNRCLYANPITWIEYHGYTCMADLLSNFEYDEIDTLDLKDRNPMDTLNAHWARRPGHYNP